MANVVFENGIRYWWSWRGQEGIPLVLDPDAPPQLYTGTELYLQMSFRNQSTTTWYVRPWVNIYPPVSRVWGTGLEELMEVPAGQTRSYTFGPILMNELGLWQAMFFLAEAATPDAVPEDIHTDMLSVAHVVEAPVDIRPVIGAVTGLAVMGVLMAVLPKMLEEGV